MSEQHVIEVGRRRIVAQLSHCNVGALRYRAALLDTGGWKPSYPDDAFSILEALHAGRADRPGGDAQNPLSAEFRMEYSRDRDSHQTLNGVFVDAPQRVLIGEVEYIGTPTEETSTWWTDEGIDRFLTGLEELSRAGSTEPLRDEPPHAALKRMIPAIVRVIEQDPAIHVTTTRSTGRVAKTEQPYTEMRHMTFEGTDGGELFVSAPPDERALGMRLRRFRGATMKSSNAEDLGMPSNHERLLLGDLSEFMLVRGADSSELSVVIGLQRCGMFVELGSLSLHRKSWERPLRQAAERVDALLRATCDRE